MRPFADLPRGGLLRETAREIENLRFALVHSRELTERHELVEHRLDRRNIYLPSFNDNIILADEELRRRIESIDGFPETLASKIRHVVLAHHGRKEWGSPVEPMFPEALAVHEADDLDAKLDNMITKRNEAITEDDWIWDSRHARLIYLR